MALLKKTVQRLVTISIGEDGNVTHAWQVTTFAIEEDGIEISRQQTGQENVEPADIGGVVPQAELLRQITQLQAEVSAGTAALREKQADRDRLQQELSSLHHEA